MTHSSPELLASVVDRQTDSHSIRRHQEIQPHFKQAFWLA